VKRRWLFSLLVLALLLTLALGALWKGLPVWIAARIDAAVRDKGFVTRTTVSQLSSQGMRVDLQILKPVELRLPSLDVEWDFLGRPDRIKFAVRSVESTGLDLTQFRKLRLRSKRLVVEGVWRPGDLSFTRIDGAFALETPLVADVVIRPALLDSLGGWRASLSIPAQDLSFVLGVPLTLASDSKLEAEYSVLAPGLLKLTSESLRFQWKLTDRGRVGLTLRQASVSTDLGQGSAPVYVFQSAYSLLWQSLRSSGKFSWKGSSLTDGEVRVEDRLVSKNFSVGDLVLGSGSLATRVDARLVGGQLVSGTLSAKGILDKLLYGKVPFEGLSLDASLRCRAIPLGDLSRTLLGKGCDILSPGLRLEVEKFLDKQPVRGASLVLGPSSGGKWIGNFSSQWQGAPLRSLVVEVDRDLRAGRLKIVGEKLSLSEVILALDSPKLSGKGVMNLRADFDWTAARGLRVDALFESMGPGVVRYIDPALQGDSGAIETLDAFQMLLAQGQQALVLKALEDFHYKTLRAVVTRDPDLLMRAELSLSGANPGLARSQPFEFNIPIEGDLESLLFNSVLRDFSRREKRRSPSPRQ